MRTSLALVLAIACSAGAQEVLGPGDYMKIMEASKLTYSLGPEPPKDPLPRMTCGRRDVSHRVVREDDGELSLVEWKVAPAARKALDEAEKAYAANDYETARKHYAAAMEADPQSVEAVMYYGDTLLFGANDDKGALAHYEKAIALDPTLPAPHFFASTALVRLGRIDEAREQMVQALTYYPGYEAAWRALTNHRRLNIKPIQRHPFNAPATLVGKKSRNRVPAWIGKDGAWLGYAMCKAVWANEQRFAKQHSADGWSTEEEAACVTNQVEGMYNATSARLEDAKQPTDDAAVRAAMPPLEQHLLEVAQEGLLDGYILFEILGQQCPLAMSLLKPDAVEKVQAYIRKYVLVPAN